MHLMPRPSYQAVLDDLGLLDELTDYQPMVIGTPPLGIDIGSSDIDVACTADDLEQFVSDMTKRFGNQAGFTVAALSEFADPAVRIAFTTSDWEVELFCQAIPIAEQWGVRHFLIERRLLAVQPALRNKVIELKKSDFKTEPAFARLLGLEGDPYEAMLKLEALSDDELAALVAQPM